MTLEQAQQEVTKYQFEHNINQWTTAMNRMMALKNKTSDQVLATELLQKWLDTVS